MSLEEASDFEIAEGPRVALVVVPPRQSLARLHVTRVDLERRAPVGRGGLPLTGAVLHDPELKVGLRALLDECQPWYDKLFERAIRAETQGAGN